MCGELRFVNLQTNEVLDENKLIKNNAMLKVRPELFIEWDFHKNNELGLDVYEVGERILMHIGFVKMWKSFVFKDLFKMSGC